MKKDLVLSIEFPVAWGEMDAFGHVNNVAYFRYLETARMHYLERIGITHPSEQNGIGLVLAETRCTFHIPLSFPDTLTVHTGITKVGNTSFHMAYEVHSSNAGLAAEADSVQVMYNYTTATKTPIPDKIRIAIKTLQNNGEH